MKGSSEIGYCLQFFFSFVYFLNKVDGEVSLSFQESQTENHLTHVVMIITFAEI